MKHLQWIKTSVAGSLFLFEMFKFSWEMLFFDNHYLMLGMLHSYMSVV